MNHTEKKYTQFALCNEMLETVNILNSIKTNNIKDFTEPIKGKKGLFLTGEGSSRIFPAKNAVYINNQHRNNFNIFTEGATQALEYDLTDFAVLGASNSGKTRELIYLLRKLKEENHDALFGMTANEDTPLEEIVTKIHILTCGKENAVAATKSVIEQGLFYHSLLAELYNLPSPNYKLLGNLIESALNLNISPEIIASICCAETIYFAGRNNGVAEELTLKTNEITRKKSDYLEGTYAVHGIEEVMKRDDAVILINPFPSEINKFDEVLRKGVGMTVIAISTCGTIFPTIVIPEMQGFNNYLELAAGWNLLVEIGIALGINLDKPVRARKIGNELIL